MKIKAKLSLGLFFLFGVILIVGGLGIFYINEISSDAKNIIKANYESIEYMQGMNDALNNLQKDSITSLDRLTKNLNSQKINITELGELEETNNLENSLNAFKLKAGDSLVRRMRESIFKITDLNLKAILKKNSIAESTAQRATIYVIVILTICFIVSFSFIVNFPGYIANPIVQLTASIKAIANKDYEERLQFNRSDEFEELAQAFNSMAEKMDEYEHSNLANLLFEKKRIETIINRLNDPVIGLDNKRNIIFANSEALELLNRKEEELVGHYAPDVAVNNDLLRRLLQEMKNPSDPDQPLKIFADNKESYFTVDVTPISFTPTGEKEEVLIGTVIMLRNITSFKELDLAKTNFMAAISHQLKTPIDSLKMGIKLLQESKAGSLNKEQGRIVQSLGDEIQQLNKLTGNLLDLTQVETGNIKLNVTSISPSYIVEQAGESVKFQAIQRKVKVFVELDEDLPLVQADKDKTTWVLINFLTNAIRHSPENGEVKVRCTKENDFVSFKVKDSGMGIEPKHLEKIFDRYYRVPGADPKKGSGFGLSICKEFIEAQRGHVFVTSEVGKGSEFSFSLLSANS